MSNRCASFTVKTRVDAIILQSTGIELKHLCILQLLERNVFCCRIASSDIPRCPVGMCRKGEGWPVSVYSNETR